MKVTVEVDLPDVEKNLAPADRGSLRWAGVSMRMLRSSWGVSLSAVLRAMWPDDEFVVHVRDEAIGIPLWMAGQNGVTMLETEKMDLAVFAAGFSWLAGLGHLSTLRLEAKRKAAKR